ncbi:MAG: type VI secretion system baseplate subunit TssF [Desulfomonilia bacterium]
MDDSLLRYYERELTYFREMGSEFAKKYPKIAARLQLEPDKCEDPHTERLIEAFAFLCARIHRKIDDDFPEITESLLSIIYPHYLNPIPSMSVVKFEPIKPNIPPTGYRIPEGTTVYSKPVGGTACQFSTAYPVTVWPLEVASAGLKDPLRQVRGAQKAIQIGLKTFTNQKISSLPLETLRFFLNGPHQHIFNLYELLFNNVCHVECQYTDKKGSPVVVELSPRDILPVGFDPEEALLPYSNRSFPAYILLFEYFCFPEKFLFFDLKGLKQIGKAASSDALDIWIYLDRPPRTDIVINQDTFCLNTSPVVNIFKRIAEPIRIERQKTEYRLVADVRRQMATEVFSVDRVIASPTGQGEEQVEYRPFYSVRHHLEDPDSGTRRVFWHTQRQPSGKKGDSGTEVFLSFADLDFKPTDPGVDIITVETTCSNRDLPARLSFGDPSGDFTMDIAAPVSRIMSLVKPTPTRRSTLGGSLQWKLISHLSLNYLSIVQGGEEALKEILKLYDFENSPSTTQQISGITSVSSRHITRRMGESFCRGLHVSVVFDEDKYIGSGLFLFACILERFLAQYVSVNSFTQLEARTVQRKDALKTWPPRSGNQVLL